MTTTTLSSREFSQNFAKAKKATENGPVIITDGGKPTHVLLRFDEYQLLVGQQRNIADTLAMPDAENIEFDPPRLDFEVRPADFE